jgi:hypothetical protein
MKDTFFYVACGALQQRIIATNGPVANQHAQVLLQHNPHSLNSVMLKHS